MIECIMYLQVLVEICPDFFYFIMSGVILFSYLKKIGAALSVRASGLLTASQTTKNKKKRERSKKREGRDRSKR